MIKFFTKELKGEVEIINAYKEDISPCIDCRYCWKVKGCSIKDGMQDIYRKIDKADNVVFASPVYFNSVTSPLKAVIDRFQTYWAKGKRKDKIKQSPKNGAVLLVGGAPKHKNQFTGSKLVIDRVFKDLNVVNLGYAHLYNSDIDSIDTLERVKEDIINLSKEINEQHTQN